jgi:hypothetical protein
MYTGRCGNTGGQKCCAKGSGKEVKIQLFRYRDTANVDPEMCSYTGYNWSSGVVMKSLREYSGTYIRKTFDRFTSADSYTWNITHPTESTAV